MNCGAKYILFSMKLITYLLLLAASFGLFKGASAGVSEISLDLIEKLKISDDLPEAPLEVEEETFVDNVSDTASVNEIPAIPVEDDRVVAEDHNDGCSISIRSGLTDPQPVFLQTDTAAFYPFSEKGLMQINTDETMQMFCPGQFKHFDKTLITATCVSGSIFTIDGNTYKFSEFVCKSWPGFVVRKTGQTCNGGNLLKVGFQVSPNRFVEQMQICFNEEEEVTRYVYHVLQAGSNYFQTAVERINFQTAGYFGGKNVDKLYTQKTQQEVINADLGGTGSKYFDSSKNVFLARGHMGAKADFLYGSQQRATFLFINTAPQWQVFNAGNWARIEDGLRAWVSKQKIFVECYTGVYGVTTLPNIEGRETPLYLSRDANNNGLIPVPKLYFRVVIEPATQRGIVFVGVNNPHLSMERIRKEYIICKDVSAKVNYINWKRTDIRAGYSYACEVSDFLRTVKHLPRLSASGGLLVQD